MMGFLRRLRADLLTTCIAIGGLALGLAAVLLMALFVRFETSYDAFLPDAERLFKATTIRNLGNIKFLTGGVRPDLAALTVAEVPEVEAFTRADETSLLVDHGGAEHQLDAARVDANFLEVPGFPLVAGTPATALARPDALVLTRSAARKLFGDGDPLGLTVATETGPPHGDRPAGGFAPQQPPGG